MPLNAIASAIYEVLQPLAHDPNATIPYGRLVDQVNDNHRFSPPLKAFHDKRLYDSLGDIANACQESGLPPLTAIVVQESELSPAPGYHKMRHPHLKDELEKLGAWIEDLKKVRAAEFPATL